MAVIKLGALITNIAGSVGGTTFTRGRNNITMSNKSRGQSFGSTQKNGRRNILASIMGSWRTLSDSEKAGWQQLALEYQLPDKFGTLKNLTGRQFYIKYTAQSLVTSNPSLSPFTFSPVIPVMSMLAPIFEYPYFNAFVSVDTTDILSTWCFSLAVSLKGIPPVSTKPDGVFFTIRRNTSLIVNFTTEVLAKYPYINQSYGARLFLYTVNDSGVKSPTISLPVSWESSDPP